MNIMSRQLLLGQVIINGAAYLFDKTPNTDNQHWKADLELEQYRRILGLEKK